MLQTHQKQLRQLFAVDRPGKENMMDEEERAFLANQPDQFEIYRGYGKTVNGWSWTVDREKAIWFAQRLDFDSPTLATGTVQKADVLAYFAGRKESEIIVDPKKVKVKSKTKLEVRKEQKAIGLI